MRIKQVGRKYKLICLSFIIAIACFSVASISFAQVSTPRSVTSAATATASSTTNEAWIAMGNSTIASPVRTIGNINISAASAGGRNQNPSANVSAAFAYPAGGPQYMVRFTSIQPIYSSYQSYGGVAINKPIFGSMGSIADINLPETTAYIAVFGKADITSGNRMIAQNQNAIVLVTPPIHDNNHGISAQPDTSMPEISLIIPGPITMAAQSSLPSNGLMVYWPSASYNLKTSTTTLKPVPASARAASPALPGRGPDATLGSAILHGMMIKLTNKGIWIENSSMPFGLYKVTVINNSSRRRGLSIAGNDLCCTEFKRLTSIIAPGQRQSFRFFFAPGKVTLRDYFGASKTTRAYTDMRWSGFSNSITFE